MAPREAKALSGEGPVPLEAGSLSARATEFLGPGPGSCASQALQVILTNVCEPGQFTLPFRTACNALFLWLFTACHTEVCPGRR